MASERHWVPRQGAPSNNFEVCAQTLIKVLACLPVYTAIIVTIVLLLIVFGVPFVEGR